MKKPWPGICIIVPSCDTRKRVITIIVSTRAMVKARGGVEGTVPRGGLIAIMAGNRLVTTETENVSIRSFYDRSNRTIERLRFCISPRSRLDRCLPPRCCNSTRRDCNSERDIATKNFRKERNEIKLRRFLYPLPPPPLLVNCLLIGRWIKLDKFRAAEGARNY